MKRIYNVVMVCSVIFLLLLALSEAVVLMDCLNMCKLRDVDQITNKEQTEERPESEDTLEYSPSI